MQQQTTNQHPQPIAVTVTEAHPPTTDVAVIASAVAWPVTALLIAVLLRKQIGEALSALTRSGTKVTLPMLAIEMAGTAQANPWSQLAVDEIRDTATTAQAFDSSSALVNSLQTEGLADYAVVDIKLGEAWLTSRLYLVAALMPAMRGIEVIVFVGAANGAQRALGLAFVEDVRWGLAQRYPWLELAYADAYRQELGQVPAPQMDRGQLQFRARGAMEPWRAENIVRGYISRLQQNVTTKPSTDSWVELRPGLWERAQWIDQQKLHDRLGAQLITIKVKDGPTVDRTTFVRHVLRAGGRFVAVVNDDGEFVRLINRGAFADRTLRRVAEEV